MTPAARTCPSAAGKLRVAAVAAAMLVFATAAKEIELLDRWTGPAGKLREFNTVLIIGISADAEVRRSFEDQFVTLLRGRRIQAITSNSIVPELANPGDRESILAMVRDQQVDAAITVRAVPLADLNEKEWSTAWKARTAKAGTIRELVQETLPLSGDSADKYGVEAALWEAGGWTTIWAGRTGSYSRKQLAKQAGVLVRAIINDLSAEGLL
jgi:hypothetical protein